MRLGLGRDNKASLMRARRLSMVLPLVSLVAKGRRLVTIEVLYGFGSIGKNLIVSSANVDCNVVHIGCKH